MGILLAFAPFLVFVIVERTAGQLPALVAATVVSAFLLVRDGLSKGRSVKVLEIGTLALFGILAAIALTTSSKWSVIGVRLRVDAGLLAIVLASIALHRPFTLQYAREGLAAEVWSQSGFLRTNYIVTWIWAAAFAVLVAADLLMLYMPDLPRVFGIGATVIATYGAMRFTSWYPARARSAAGLVSTRG